MAYSKSIVERSLFELFKHSGIDWRSALDGQTLVLELMDVEPDEHSAVLIFEDGVRLTAPVQQFDAISTASALLSDVS